MFSLSLLASRNSAYRDLDFRVFSIKRMKAVAGLWGPCFLVRNARVREMAKQLWDPSAVLFTGWQ